MIAKVEPLTTARALRGPFDYRLPEPFDGVGVGSLLVVPFGRRRVLGVVVDISGRSSLPPDRLAAPLEALEMGVPVELVRLALWMAGEYCSTPARALSLVLPPRGRPRTELWARRTEASLEGERLTDNQRALLRLPLGTVAREIAFDLRHGKIAQPQNHGSRTDRRQQLARIFCE